MENKQLPADNYQPVGCEHKHPNGISAWMFHSEESGSGPNIYFDVHVSVCQLCGTIRIGGFRQDKEGKLNRFSEEISIHATKAIDAMIKYANYIHGEKVWGRKHPGIGWVKCSDRLPGYKKRVKWRDGNDHSYATDGEISLFEMDKPNLEGWEWLDESGAAAAPTSQYDNALYETRLALRDLIKLAKLPGRSIAEYRQRIEAAEGILNKHTKVTDVLRTASPAAGREEDNAVEFAEWRDENYIPVYRSIQYWIPKLPEHSNDVEPYTADQLYELFKQQKIKV